MSSTPKELCQSNAAQAPAAPSKSPQDSEAAKDGNNNVRPVTRTTNPPVIKPAAPADKAPKTEESCLANGGGNGAPDQLPAAAEVKLAAVDVKASKQQPNGAVKSSANVVPTSSNPMSSSVGVAAGPVTTSVPSGVLSYAQVAQREKDLGAGDGEKEGVVVKDNNSSATVNASGGKKEKKEGAGAGE